MKRLYNEWRIATESCDICGESFVDGEAEFDHIDGARHEDGRYFGVTQYGRIGSVSYQRFLEEHELVRPLHRSCHQKLRGSVDYGFEAEVVRAKATALLNKQTYVDLPTDFLEWINE